jgi:hypothetical protein
VDGTELRARPDQRIRVPVGTDAAVVRWTVRRGSSVVARGQGPTVALRAPAKPGRYALVIDAAAHRRQVAVVVSK